MINLLVLTISLANPVPVQTAQFRPCVWPNVCNTEAAPTVAQFRPCVWPNRCKTETSAPIIEVAQFTTCVMPKKCGKNA